MKETVGYATDNYANLQNRRQSLKSDNDAAVFIFLRQNRA